MTKPLAIIPVERTEDWWQARHQQKLREAQLGSQHIELVFLGDSITHAWELEGEQAWKMHFSGFPALNLGYAGDRTEHLLWRIQNGELENLTPNWLVVLIGTNNAGHRHDRPEDIALGIKAVLDELTKRLPSSKILLMAIFPRSRNKNKPMRKRIDTTNTLIEPLADGNHIHWLNINHLFLNEDDVLQESVMPDLLHPNQAQYPIWAQQVLTSIQTSQS